MDEPGGLGLHPVAQGVHPAVQVQQLTNHGANGNGNDGDEGILSFQTAADANIEHAQGHPLHNDGLQAAAAAADVHILGRTVGGSLKDKPQQRAGQNGQGIDDGSS